MNSQEAHEQFGDIIAAGVDRCITLMKVAGPVAKSSAFIAEGVRIPFDGGVLEVARITVRIRRGKAADEFRVTAAVQESPAPLADNALSVEGGAE